MRRQCCTYSLAAVLLLSMMSSTTSLYLFPFGDLWSYLDNNTALSAASGWTGYFYDDSTWPMNYGPLGAGVTTFTNLTTNSVGSSTRYMTYYFRKKFNALLPSVSVINAVISFKAIDGIVIYVNGAEVNRTNMPRTSSATTAASSCLPVDTRENVTTVTLASGVLLPGDNVIAAEVHRCSTSATRSTAVLFDLAVDYTLAPSVTPSPLPSPDPGVPYGSTWFYLDNNVDRTGTTWRTSSSFLSPWLSGEAPFGVGTTLAGAPKTTLTTASGVAFPMYYFRYDYPMTATKGTRFTGFLTVAVSDGAVVYVNGDEIGRINMPEQGNIIGTTTALSTVINPNASAVTFRLEPGTLIIGNNRIAVEIHQASWLSPTAYFDAKLDWVTEPTPSPTPTRSPSTSPRSPSRSPSVGSSLSSSVSLSATPSNTPSSSGTRARSFSRTPSKSISSSVGSTPSASPSYVAPSNSASISETASASAVLPSSSPSTGSSQSITPSVSVSVVMVTPSMSPSTGGVVDASTSPSKSAVISASQTASASVTRSLLPLSGFGGGNSDSSLTTGQIAGIIVGAGIGVSLCIAGCGYVSVKQFQKKQAMKLKALPRTHTSSSQPDFDRNPAVIDGGVPVRTASAPQQPQHKQPPPLHHTDASFNGDIGEDKRVDDLDLGDGSNDVSEQRLLSPSSKQLHPHQRRGMSRHRSSSGSSRHSRGQRSVISQRSRVSRGGRTLQSSQPQYRRHDDDLAGREDDIESSHPPQNRQQYVAPPEHRQGHEPFPTMYDHQSGNHGRVSIPLDQSDYDLPLRNRSRMTSQASAVLSEVPFRPVSAQERAESRAIATQPAQILTSLPSPPPLQPQPPSQEVIELKAQVTELHSALTNVTELLTTMNKKQSLSPAPLPAPVVTEVKESDKVEVIVPSRKPLVKRHSTATSAASEASVEEEPQPKPARVGKSKTKKPIKAKPVIVQPPESTEDEESSNDDSKERVSTSSASPQNRQTAPVAEIEQTHVTRKNTAVQRKQGKSIHGEVVSDVPIVTKPALQSRSTAIPQPQSTPSIMWSRPSSPLRAPASVLDSSSVLSSPPQPSPGYPTQVQPSPQPPYHLPAVAPPSVYAQPSQPQPYPQPWLQPSQAAQPPMYQPQPPPQYPAPPAPAPASSPMYAAPPMTYGPPVQLQPSYDDVPLPASQPSLPAPVTQYYQPPPSHLPTQPQPPQYTMQPVVRIPSPVAPAQPPSPYQRPASPTRTAYPPQSFTVAPQASAPMVHTLIPGVKATSYVTHPDGTVVGYAPASHVAASTRPTLPQPPMMATVPQAPQVVYVHQGYDASPAPQARRPSPKSRSHSTPRSPGSNSLSPQRRQPPTRYDSGVTLDSLTLSESQDEMSVSVSRSPLRALRR